MTNRFSICLILSTLTISIAIAYATTTFLFKTTTNLLANAFAQETAEERAHEENENVQNGFSPVNPELTKQAINRSQNTGGGINLSPKSLIQSGAPLLGNPSAPVTIVEFGVL